MGHYYTIINKAEKLVFQFLFWTHKTNPYT